MNFIKRRVLALILITAVLYWCNPVMAGSSGVYNSAKINGVSIKYVTLDMKNNNIKPVVLNAQNQFCSVDTLASMAQAAGAFAAINGTYFEAYGGVPVPWGTIIKNGKVLHISQSGAVVGITSNGRLLVDRLSFDFKGYINGQYRAIPWRINHPSPEPGAITIFTPEYGTMVNLLPGAKAVYSGYPRQNTRTVGYRHTDIEFSGQFIYMVFPPDGEREIDRLLQPIADLKRILKRIEPGLKQAEKAEAVARDRFDNQKKAFYEKYPERVVFSKPLVVVKEELQQEYEELRIRQDYLNGQESNLQAERERFSEAQAELDKKDERYEYLSDKVIAVDLPSAVLQDFPYRTTGIVNHYITKLQEEQAQVNQLREDLRTQKRRLELFCQEEIKDARLRRKVMNGLELRDNYQEVLDWQSRLSQRIALAIRHAEDDMREHDRELQQFINYLHNYLQTMAGELRIIPRKTRVKVEEDWKDIFLFEVPDWDEQEGKSELRRHVDWMISQIESDQYKDDSGNEDYARLHRDIEKWLRPQQLLRNVMKEKNIKVRCRKVTADGKVSSHPSPWESSNQWSGGEKWSKNMALFLGIQNYLAEKRQATNPGMKRNRAVILDNPFGKASSEHVLDPVFFIAEHLGFQIIALTALAEGSFVRDYFPIVYSCRLRPSTSADKSIMATHQEIRHAYFQDHEPEALRRLGEQKQLELF